VAEFANEPPKSPVLLHFGETDQSISQDHWDTIRTAQPKVPMHIYQGGGPRLQLRTSARRITRPARASPASARWTS